LVVFLVVAGGVLLLLQLLDLVVQGVGACASCNVGSDTDVLWSAAAGGGAAATNDSVDLFDKNFFGKLKNQILGGDEPRDPIEGMDQPLPGDPGRAPAADVDWLRTTWFYEGVNDENSWLNSLGRSARRGLGYEVREPEPPPPLPDPPPLEPRGQ